MSSTGLAWLYGDLKTRSIFPVIGRRNVHAECEYGLEKMSAVGAEVTGRNDSGCRCRNTTASSRSDGTIRIHTCVREYMSPVYRSPSCGLPKRKETAKGSKGAIGERAAPLETEQGSLITII